MPARKPQAEARAASLEDDFVTPLTTIRGLLEILRDCPDLPPSERRRFVDMALTDCARLDRGIERLLEED
ncbi:MAG: hypothetical protein TEF_21555 [Rhizobiales bacterium NRL2]|jgi:K+-sensing histidine kinase KdpD|nr:MAG: hypothetical protein TEF_21555 [Rhizobiales bacterium NRL2]